MIEETMQMGAWQPMRGQPLQLESEAYRAHLADWSRDHAGEFVLICGSAVMFFQSLDEALDIGYRDFDRQPFFVKEITAPEHVEVVTALR